MTVRAVLLVLLVAGLAGSLVVGGTLAAFSLTTSVSDQGFDAGTVALDDEDAGAAIFDGIDGMLPSDPGLSRCIRVTYGGTLDADVRLYTTTPPGDLGPYLQLTISKGTVPAGNAFRDCTGFVAEGGALFDGTLTELATDHADFAGGLPAAPGAAASWSTGDVLAYKIDVSVLDDVAAEGKSSSAVELTWEARDA